MASIQVTLKGDAREFPAGISVAGIAKEIGAGLYKAACAGKINGEVVDLRTPVPGGLCPGNSDFPRCGRQAGLLAHGVHVMAQAVKRLYPEAKLAIGPSIDQGFYYDIDLERPLTPEDLPKIEAEIKKIIKENLPLERFELPADEAKGLMEKQGQDYKVELMRSTLGKVRRLVSTNKGSLRICVRVLI